MQLRRLQIREVINQQCGFYTLSFSPYDDKNLLKLPKDVKKAFVLHKGYLYYIDQDLPEKKSTYIKLDNTKMSDLKSSLGITDRPFKSGEECQVHIANLSSEELEKIILITDHSLDWIQKVVALNNQWAALQTLVWQSEANLIALEKQIAELEEHCTKKWGSNDLEELYPSKYKKSDLRPTDFKEIKLKELNKRIENLESKENKEALNSVSLQVKDLRNAFKEIEKTYLEQLWELQKYQSQLNEYCNKTFSDEKSRSDLLVSLAQLPMEHQLQIISMIPGSVSLGILIDTFAQLKGKYENALRAGATIEEIFSHTFEETIKDHFKEFAKKPTEEISKIIEDIDKITTRLLQSLPESEEKQKNVDRLAAYLKTLIYLSCTLETFRFTDQVQNINGMIGILSNAFVIGEFALLTVCQMQNSFAAMPISATQIIPLESANLLWLQAALWLRGLYQRSYQQIPPYLKEGGVVKEAVFQHINDSEDRKFFDIKPPLVKWTLAQYHDQHGKNILDILPASILEKVLPFFKEETEVKKQKPVQQENRQEESKEKEKESSQVVEQNEIETKNQVPQQKEKEEEKVQLIEANTIEEKTQLQQQPKKEPMQLTSTGLGTTPCLFKRSENPPASPPLLQQKDLDDIQNKVNLAKFTKLKMLLENSRLTDEQNALIKDIKEQILGLLKKYKGAYFTSNWIPTVLADRKHLPQVKKAYKDITQSQEPVQYILALLEVWKAATADRSPDIGPNAEKLLQAIFDLLHSGKPEERLERKNHM